MFSQPAARPAVARHNSVSYPGSHRHRHHWFYVWIPLAAAVMWFGTILALLVTWLASGRPHYVSMDSDQTIAYISDVAADILKPLFIVGCSITAVGFFLSLAVERWARHEGRLLPNMRRREKVMSSLAIVWSFVGGAGLILLSIFDTKRHMRLHRVFLLIFVAGTAFSAIFTIIEFRWLDKTFGYRFRKLRIAYLFKAAYATVLIILAIAFGALLDSKPNPGAVVEWTISFLFTLYLLSFWYDLRQSRNHAKGDLSPQHLMGYNGQVDPGMVERGSAL
ncbi:uncharacterized protein FOMMEDRAFT_144900 [Fomitiporia mediterranea MF3/22]|uniref:uncharacterized protein n=1 Tax=Fomitiporia mediterranea (strain MF3/22) TaxID=694068 RepID=UPI0004408F50|nr:uncharacterized protein FOMMEDRAFT_144900 [Fomitiporia mediterranea MF3/22]EJD07165.1 hypothetical protein FOMMEDRAFT_144900 [Fomitiporia mediterranea MF3/22]